MGYDDQGQPIYEDELNNSRFSRPADGSILTAGQYQSEDDLLGERGYNAETGTLSNMAATMDRQENGHQHQPPNEYESYDDIQRQVSKR